MKFMKKLKIIKKNMLIEIIIFMIILIIFHELSHMTFAILNGGKIVGIGFNVFPFPFIYVKAINVKNLIGYYLAGPIFDLLALFIIFFMIKYKPLKIAILINVILNSNPFFSDWLLIKNYKWTLIWYLHFSIWGALIIFLSKIV